MYIYKVLKYVVESSNILGRGMYIMNDFMKVKMKVNSAKPRRKGKQTYHANSEQSKTNEKRKRNVQYTHL